MSSLRRKLRQKKDQNSKRIKEGLRADPFDDFDEESIRPKKEEDEDEDSSTNGSDSDDGVGDDDGYGVTVGEVGDSAGDDADPEAHRGANDADREGNGTSDRETKQNDQQDWYSKGIMEEPGGSSGGGDEGRGGPGASIQPASQAKPFFRVRRRTYRSRTIIGRARGWIKDRTDDFKEWANGMILDNQYGPPYLLEKNRDFYQEACKVNPGVMIIHDHLKAKTNPNYTGSRHHRKASGRGAGFTAAHYAALYANVILLEMLIRAEADLNIQATCGRTPLLIACAGTYPNHHKVTKILLKYGADPDLRDRGGNSPLSLAIRKSDIYLVRVLLKTSVTVNRESTFSHVDQGETDVEVAKKVNVRVAKELSEERQFLSWPERALYDLIPSNASRILKLVASEAARQERIRKIVSTVVPPRRVFNHKEKRAALRHQQREEKETVVMDMYRAGIASAMDRRDEEIENEKRRNSKKPAGNYDRIGPGRWVLQTPKTMHTTGSMKPLKPTKKERKSRISPAEYSNKVDLTAEIRRAVRESQDHGSRNLTADMEIIDLDDDR